MSVATLTAVLAPAAALVAALTLARRGRTVMVLSVLAAGWGVASTWLAIGPEERWLETHSPNNLVVVGAPIIEELLKALILPALFVIRRTRWFVDGAMIGLAAGTGFAIRENLVYLRGAGDAALDFALARVTSTNLMHAGCTAIVGAVVCTPALTTKVRALVSLPIAAALAILLHMAFNRLTFGMSAAVTTTTVGIGVFGLSIALIALGVVLSTRWARRTLERQGVAEGEWKFVGGRRTVSVVLDEMTARFGADVARAGADYVAVQRQLGVVVQPGRAPAPHELERLDAAANAARRRMGVFPLLWLRSRLPLDQSNLGLWTSTEVTDLTTRDSAPGGLWATLTDNPTPAETNDPQPD